MDNEGEADYLDECMDTVDVDSGVKEFKQAFCSRCYRRECTHSQWGKPGWLNRMYRQAKALTDPDRLDPNHPEAEGLADQDFDDVRDLEVDAWSMPDDLRDLRDEETSEGGRVHKSEPPTKRRSSEKVDESLEALDGDPSNFQSASEAASEDGDDGSSEPERDSPSESERTESESSDSEDSEPDTGGLPNTEMPDGGVVVGGGPESDDATTEGSESDADEWTRPDHVSDDGGLTVNVDDGTRVDD